VSLLEPLIEKILDKKEIKIQNQIILSFYINIKKIIIILIYSSLDFDISPLIVNFLRTLRRRSTTGG